MFTAFSSPVFMPMSACSTSGYVWFVPGVMNPDASAPSSISVPSASVPWTVHITVSPSSTVSLSDGASLFQASIMACTACSTSASVTSGLLIWISRPLYSPSVTFAWSVVTPAFSPPAHPVRHRASTAPAASILNLFRIIMPPLSDSEGPFGSPMGIS